MQVEKVQNNNPNFGMKIAPHFSQTVQNFYNYGKVPNKRKLIWEFNQQAEKYKNFGHDDYTLDYEKKLKQGNWVHYLTATKDNGKEKVVISVRSTLAKIIEHFMKMNKYEINYKFQKK